jgi:DNA-binding NtrC family response regulator
VLRNEGYGVHGETSVSEALRAFTQGDFDLAILCHTIPEREKLRTLTAMKKAKPSMPVVIMRLDGEAAKLADASVRSLDGPDSLLNCVATLLTRQALSCTSE